MYVHAYTKTRTFESTVMNTMPSAAWATKANKGFQ